METDPDLSARAFERLAIDSTERLRLIQHFAMRRAEADPEDALKWSESLGSEKEISVARCQIALVLAESDPHQAAGLLSEHGIEGREFDVALVQVIQRWAAQSPAAAAGWAVNFRAGEARTASIREIVGRWIEADPTAVFAWKSGLSDPSIRQDVTAALVDAAAVAPEDSPPSWLDSADEETRQALRNAKP